MHPQASVLELVGQPVQMDLSFVASVGNNDGSAATVLAHGELALPAYQRLAR